MTKKKMLNSIKEELSLCKKCKICTSQQVFYAGNPGASPIKTISASGLPA